MELIKDNILIKREVDVVITPQAQRVLSQTKFTIEEFIEWVLVEQKLSFGGSNVALFLEKMHINEVKEIQ